MRKVVWSLAFLLILSSTTTVIADYHTIEIESLGRIESQALALNDVQLNPQRDRILAVGDEGYAILLDAASPDTASSRIKFDTGVTTVLNSVAWHTGGKTAFLAGDSGVILRYVESTQSIENVEGTGQLEGTDIEAISWRNNGDRAYLGGEAGRIYSYDSENGFQLLDQTAESMITSIACHRHHTVCIVTTLQDGVAIIDRDSQVHWLGSKENTWISSVCSDPDVNECVVVASGRRISAIILKPDDAGSSIVEPAEIIGELSGEFTGITSLQDNSISITMAPYGLIEYRLDNRVSYKMLEHDLVKDSEIELSSTNIIQVWGDDMTHGFIISSDGSIAQFTPTTVEDDELIMKVVMLVLLISVPGSIIGLIFMNSKTLQGWYFSLRKAKRAKSQENAKELEMQKVASKKNKDSD
jgi:hypothetical protein